MINILPDNKSKCCGCTACEQICPQQCISIQEDMEGFSYPVVDRERCVDCGLCERVCPVTNRNSSTWRDNSKRPRAIGGYHKNEEVRLESSSGGAFSLFAQYILTQGGVVYGCTLDEKQRAIHVSIDNIEELFRLRKSKYVQSDICGIYSHIKEQLTKERMVLFVGTPCQCAGLCSFLGNKDYDNLYTVDFICHGVPSPKVFQEYVTNLEKENNSKIVEFTFRNKDEGWKSSGLQMGTKIQFEDGKIIRNAPAFKDSFMNGFLDDLYLRPICYECPFKTLPKNYADVTIADFWGVNKVDKEINDGKGTSLLLLHSVKGEKLFEVVKNDFHYREYDFDKAIKGNPTLFHSAKMNVNRNHFFSDFQNEEYNILKKKYLSAFTWAMHKALNLGWKIFKRVICIFLSLFKIELTEKQENKFFQFVKFGLVGVSNTAISLGINFVTLFLLQPLQFSYDYVIANLMGFSLSVLWSYIWNNRYVFKLKKGETRSRKKTLLKTYMSYGFSGIILNNSLSTIWINVLNISKFFAPFMNLAFTIPVNFLLNKLWAYKSEKRKSDMR